MTPLLSRSQRAKRKELRQKQWHLPFLCLPMAEIKRLIAAWKGYVAEPLNSDLP